MLSKLPCDLLTENFLHRQPHNDGVVGFEEAIYLAQGVLRVTEGDEETSLAFAAAHGGIERVNALPRVALVS